MASFFSRFTLALWLLNGLSLGCYAAGFSRLYRSGFGAAAAAAPSGGWPAALWLLAGVLAGWASGAATRTAGRRWLGLTPEQAGLWAALCDLPWLLLGPGMLLYPWLSRFGAHLQLDILGQVRLPWQRTFTHLPPAGYLLLLWAGPWLTLPLFLKFASGVKLCCNRLAVRTQSQIATPIRTGALVLAAFFFYLALGVWTTTVYPPTGDEPHYLLMSVSLLRDHDLDLRNNITNGDFRAFYPAATLDFHGETPPGRPWRSKHFPLLSLLLAPAYALLGRFGAAALIMLCAAGIAALIHRFILDLGGSEAAALLVWALAVLSPPLGIYFDLIYTELPAGLILVAGVWAWLRGGPRGLLAASLAAAALPWFYPKYGLLAAVLGLALPWARGVRLRDGLVPAALLALSAAAYMWFFRIYAGPQLAGGHYGDFHVLWSASSMRNALGLLVDRDYGIFTSSPVMFLGALGWWQRQLSRRFVLLAAAAFLVQFGMYTLFTDFSGSSAVFSRNVLPGTLLLLAGIAAGGRRLWSLKPYGPAAVVVLCLAAVGTSWLCAAWPALRYLAPKLKLWSRLGWVPSPFPSLSQASGPGDYLWALAWVAVLAFSLWWVTSRKDERV